MKHSTFIFLFLSHLIFVSCTTKPIKVACIGDSITEGSGLINQSKTAYPVILDSILGDNYSVLNCGRSGATMLKDGNLPYWNCKEFYNVFAFNPDIIVIKLGTNDTKPINWNAENFEIDYQAMIDTLTTLQSSPKIYVSLPVPTYRTAWGINDSTLTAGVIPIIKKIATVNKLQIIDLYKPMDKQAGNFPDGIHPDENGTSNIAILVAEEIIN